MRVGWICDWGSLGSARYNFQQYHNFLTSKGIKSEVFEINKTYDFVVFVKAFCSVFHPLVKELRRRKTKTILLNTVNYYETWGDYPSEKCF
jgi:hypothetical protein